MIKSKIITSNSYSIHSMKEAEQEINKKIDEIDGYNIKITKIKAINNEKSGYFVLTVAVEYEIS